MIWLWIGLFFVLAVLPVLVISYVVFSILLKRTSKEKWNRSNNLPDNPEMVRIYEDAMAWRERWKDIAQDVEITSDDHLRLVGQFYDYHSDSAVIIVPGRMESCLYSCHYAESWRKAGFSVLTIDNRAHGFSEGKYNCLGFTECHDLLAWARFLHEKYGIARIYLHGICIGCSASLFAATLPDCPDYVEGIVVDGMYQRFYDTCLNHMKEQKRPLYPFIQCIMLYSFLFTGAHPMLSGPIDKVGQMKKDILFLHGYEDIYSVPEKAVELYERCASPRKQMVWFERGGHSCLRVNAPEQYDDAICAFVKKAGNADSKTA